MSLTNRHVSPESPPEHAPAVPASSFLNDAGELTRELRQMLHDQLELAALETQLAARTAITMIALAIVMGLLLVSVWLALVGAGAMALIYFGLSAVMAMIVVAILNLAGAGLAYVLLRHKARSLGWPVTLRMLKPSNEGEQSPGP